MTIKSFIGLADQCLVETLLILTLFVTRRQYDSFRERNIGGCRGAGSAGLRRREVAVARNQSSRVYHRLRRRSRQLRYEASVALSDVIGFETHLC